MLLSAQTGDAAEEALMPLAVQLVRTVGAVDVQVQQPQRRSGNASVLMLLRDRIMLLTERAPSCFFAWILQWLQIGEPPKLWAGLLFAPGCPKLEPPAVQEKRRKLPRAVN